jgi:hypothetical protein
MHSIQRIQAVVNCYRAELAEWIENHPLRPLCSSISEEAFLHTAVALAHSGLVYSCPESEIPYSPQSLEELIASTGIKIEESHESSLLSNSIAQWRFYAWSDSFENMISLNTGILQRLLSRRKDQKSFAEISLPMVRAFLIAHEWFHLFFERVEKPPDWGDLPESGRIIAEEIAARIFSILILGVQDSPLFLDHILLKT